MEDDKNILEPSTMNSKKEALGLATWIEVKNEDPRIQSWTRTSQDSLSNGILTDELCSVRKLVHFAINDVHIVCDAKDKKHVTYAVTVSRMPRPDPIPLVVERRYSHFHSLYEVFRKSFPQLTSQFKFPRKVFLGNYDIDVIKKRSHCFEEFLYFICTHEKLLHSQAFADFFCGEEYSSAAQFLSESRFEEALVPLQRVFNLLSKVLTDRHPRVMVPLCAILACNFEIADCSSAHLYAEVALHRFDGVSDVDLLLMYCPLLNLCCNLYQRMGKDFSHIQATVDRCKEKHIWFSSVPSLMEVVQKAF